jgi:hypothetical protein
MVFHSVVRRPSSNILDNRLTDGGEVVSLTHRLLFTLLKNAEYSFLLDLMLHTWPCCSSGWVAGFPPRRSEFKVLSYTSVSLPVIPPISPQLSSSSIIIIIIRDWYNRPVKASVDLVPPNTKMKNKNGRCSETQSRVLLLSLGSCLGQGFGFLYWL